MTAPAETQRTRRRRVVAVYVSLAIALVVFLVLNACIGSTMLAPADLAGALFGGATGNPIAVQIVWDIRLPRLIAAVLLGGALALAGFLLQTFFNNPIAGPYILGISSGAKFVVALVMIFVVGSSAQMTMVFVLLVSRRINSMAMLIVAGVMIGYIASAGTDFLVTFASDQNIVNLRNWSLGSFSGMNWANIAGMTPVVIVASVATFLLSKPIGAFQLGENYARSMGVNIRAFRIVLVVLSSLLAAVVTAFAGPISFVGIAVPHLVKRFLGTSKPLIVIPAAFLGGGIFCLFCDLIARCAFAPTEVSISAVTAIFGAPVVIAILLKRKRGR